MNKNGIQPAAGIKLQNMEAAVFREAQLHEQRKSGKMVSMKKMAEYEEMCDLRSARNDFWESRS